MTSTIWSDPLLIKLLTFSAFMVVLFFLLTLVRRLIKNNISDVGQRRMLRQWSGILGVGCGILVAAYTFSNGLTGLTVSLGVAGAAIAFATQQALASAIGWLQIVFGGVYKVGDRVSMGGVIGDVVQINLFLTTLMEVRGDWVNADQYSGRVVRVPNSSVYLEPIYNYSGDHDYVWDELVVPIKYGSDRKLAVKIIEDSVKPLAAEATFAMRAHWEEMKERYTIEDAELEPKVFLVANDNWLEYTVRYLVDCKKRRSMKSDLCESIISRIDENADKVGIASGTYDVVGLPPLKVDLISHNLGEKV